jgi:hypothetical protein
MRHFRDLLRGCEKSVRKRHQGVFFSESQGVSLEVDFRWYGSLSDCVLGSTENRISGSNPSLSATIFVVEITYEFAFLQVEFSPLSRGLRELNL